MLRAMIRRLAVIGIVVGACGASGARPAAPHVEAELDGGDGLACREYVVEGAAPIHDVVLSMGGTGTGTAAFLPDGERALVDAGGVAVIHFDKPGVRGTFGDPRSAQIDDATFRRHTQGALLACARDAVIRAVDRYGAVRVLLRGHSEGALIALALYDDLLATRPELAARVRALILTGLPLEPFGELLARQLAPTPDLAAAIARCDWSVMRGLGISCAYLADAEARPSGRALFERLAARAAPAEVDVLAGTDDQNTPVRFVRDLEAWNAAQGHLDLHVRYYEGAHTGTPAARQELAALLARLTTSTSP
jgi:pimeloyl-ACP methyl ester carboxylesterase